MPAPEQRHCTQTLQHSVLIIIGFISDSVVLWESPLVSSAVQSRQTIANRFVSVNSVGIKTQIKRNVFKTKLM